MEDSITIGFSNNIYNNPADVLDTVRIISTHFRAIEIELAEDAQITVFDAAPDEYAQIITAFRNMAAERSLEYSVHAAWFGPHTDLTARDTEERRASVALLARSLRFASDIGARIVTTHPGSHHDQNEKQLVSALAKSLRETVDIVAAPRVLLCVENMGSQRPSQTVLNAEAQIEICKLVGVGICLDIVHLASVVSETTALLGAVEALAPFTRHVHLGDTIRPRHRHLPIGRGDLPLAAIIERLAGVGYRGHAIVEEWNRGWSPEEYLAGALAFRQRMQASGLVV